MSAYPEIQELMPLSTPKYTLDDLRASIIGGRYWVDGTANSVKGIQLDVIPEPLVTPASNIELGPVTPRGSNVYKALPNLPKLGREQSRSGTHLAKGTPKVEECVSGGQPTR